MGKLWSKHASRRRENPEGDSFVVNAFLRRGMEECETYSATDHKLKNMLDFPNTELKDGQFTDQHCTLAGVIPQEKAEGCESYLQYLHSEYGEKEPLRDATKTSAKKHISVNDVECDVSVEDDNRQEWIFTLYDFDNSGKVTKEDMSSLMHTIYDVVDASVNHSCHNKSKTLRVKLTVTPELRSHRRDTGPALPLQSAFTTMRAVRLTSVSPHTSARGRAMSLRPPRVSITAWMRTQRGGITTWTWLALRTTRPDLKEPTQSSLLKRLMFVAPKARVALAPMSLKPKLFTTVVHRSSVKATTLQILEPKACRSSNPLKEPTREVEGITLVENPTNAMVTTFPSKRCCMVVTLLVTGVRMCTTCHTKLNPQATTNTLCSIVTANG
ncbi:protein naked cuticle homolog 2-like isoform X2 [Girardinichthys multiradiatus]|uniref:protein naked cuticle homolog 2-like isoform X2 n=1 Tax=Girardinichthys multiradiatus TaxID=208333 RepID=UPI001FAD6068|nr:protein naked cuticle homolog 2-like isoform X2 [Girardinichthys multiradiatus]